MNKFNLENKKAKEKETGAQRMLPTDLNIIDLIQPILICTDKGYR